MLQRKLAFDKAAGLAAERDNERGEQSVLQRRATNQAEPATVPPIVHEVLRSSGQPLDVTTRAFMEPRFGHDFSQVRVHTDARAARSAKAVNALAYTVGNDIVFDKGQYSPDTNEGNRILAHELSHVLQQKTYQEPLQTKLSISESANAAERQADDTADAVVFGIRKVPNSFAPAGPSIQRVCGVAAIGTRTECDDQDPIFVTGHPFFKFNVSCNDFAPGEEANLRSTAAALPASGPVEVHGYASVDGNATFNENLSCARALKARTVLTSAGITAGRISVVKHGPTPGPTADRRSVVISSTAAPGPTPPTPAPPTPSPVITSQTVATSPGVRTRTNIGVGEEVNLTHSAGSVTWATTAGTFSATTGVTVRLTAPDTAQTVTVTAGGATKAFTVIAPTGIHMDRFSGTGIRHTQHLPDSGIQTRPFLLPDNVNLYNVQYREVDVPATASGHWTCQIGDGHDAHPATLTLGSTVVAGKGTRANARDSAYSGHCGSAAPLTPGHKTWAIPNEYKVGSRPFHRFVTVTQVHTLAADASTCTSDKAGAHGDTTVAAATSTY
ncbi:MAG: DUF4157 domain-containing protein [Desulfobacteraceae bacterium]|nr:DUF4157 domain-containing protein [Desulfobacteraceae bacterium]